MSHSESKYVFNDKDFVRSVKSTPEFRYLAEHGIEIDPHDKATLRRLSHFHIARVKFFANRTFEYDREGMLAGIVMTSTPRDPVVCGDWVAWALTRPNKFAPRLCSSMHHMIGGIQLVSETPIPVWRTPLSWLKNAARGVVFVNHDLYGLYGLPPKLHLVAEDEAHKAELLDNGRCRPHHHIMVTVATPALQEVA
jgi:hypothetical protein